MQAIQQIKLDPHTSNYRQSVLKCSSAQTTLNLVVNWSGLACKQSNSLSAEGSPAHWELHCILPWFHLWSHYRGHALYLLAGVMNVIEHTIIIQHTCPAVHVCRILHCLGVGKVQLVQQVGSALSALNKTKNMCSCKSIILVQWGLCGSYKHFAPPLAVEGVLHVFSSWGM